MMTRLVPKIKDHARGNIILPFLALWGLCGESTAQREADTDLSVQDMEKEGSAPLAVALAAMPFVQSKSTLGEPKLMQLMRPWPGHL
ncbi:hypothetical protein HGM15179_015792 [Zosterops borbonicus]|uniref:Uncharacterized protein n=1 Tax=Zosterops borbonicus TaxID=364589 RepID=A0A8K1G3U2_9PASS|nr:hypothetical protein HGM15179_015792 [Zosterops borbonicus]